MSEAWDLCVVFTGAIGAGKATSLRKLHERLPEASDILTDEGSSWFDVPLSGSGKPLAIRVASHSGPIGAAPGTRKLYEQASALVFVADSAPDREAANVEAAQATLDLLAELGKRATPIILQLNKRDLPHAVPIDVLIAALFILTPKTSVHSSVLIGINDIESFRFAVRAARAP